MEASETVALVDVIPFTLIACSFLSNLHALSNSGHTLARGWNRRAAGAMLTTLAAAMIPEAAMLASGNSLRTRRDRETLQCLRVALPS